MLLQPVLVQFIGTFTGSQNPTHPFLYLITRQHRCIYLAAANNGFGRCFPRIIAKVSNANNLVSQAQGVQNFGAAGEERANFHLRCPITTGAHTEYSFSKLGETGVQQWPRSNTVVPIVLVDEASHLKERTSHQAVEVAPHRMSQELLYQSSLDAPGAPGQIPLQVKHLGHLRPHSLNGLPGRLDHSGYLLGQGWPPPAVAQDHWVNPISCQFCHQRGAAISLVSHQTQSPNPIHYFWSQGGIGGVGWRQDKVGHHSRQSDE